MDEVIAKHANLQSLIFILDKRNMDRLKRYLQVMIFQFLPVSVILRGKKFFVIFVRFILLKCGLIWANRDG